MSVHSRDFDEDHIQYEEIENNHTNTYHESDQIDEINLTSESNEEGYQSCNDDQPKRERQQK